MIESALGMILPDTRLASIGWGVCSVALKNYRVLIIEDDKDTAEFFSVVLSLVGFECELVHTGREAIARLAATQPDMVLLDMRLGQEITGEDILYQIRSNPRFEKTKVVITTAYPGMAQPITDLADLTLLKPIAMEQLQALTERLASGQPRSRQYYFRDPVTDLFNREFFLTRLEHARERARRRADFLFAVLVFRILVEAQDGEPIEPDELNHVLRQVAGRLVSAFRPTDTFARLDGERFASLHEELKKPSDPDVIVSRLKEEAGRPVQIADRLFVTKVQVGAALMDSRFQQADDLLRAAEAKLG
jgi:PleD family two-component response regulator